MGPLNLFDALKVPELIPLLERGVKALERLADAQERANIIAEWAANPQLRPGERP